MSLTLIAEGVTSSDGVVSVDVTYGKDYKILLVNETTGFKQNRTPTPEQIKIVIVSPIILFFLSSYKPPIQEISFLLRNFFLFFIFFQY